LSSDAIKKFAIAILVFTILTSGVAAVTVLLLDGGPEHTTFMYSLFLVSGTFTVFVLGINFPMSTWLLRYVEPVTLKGIVMHAVVVVASAATGFFIAVNFIDWYMDVLFNYDWDTRDVSISLLVTIIGTLGANFAFFGYHFYKRSMLARQEALKAQMNLLKAQINPHFLFNSLNTIAALVRTSPKDAESVTEDLAEVFRYSLQTGDLETVTLREEIDITRNYLNIEKARFGERLIFSEELDSESLECRVPALILQPLIENAVKHGLSNMDTPCEITVYSEVTEDSLVLMVTDTGPGFTSNDTEIVFKKGIGLQNVYGRIKNQFGANGRFTILKNGIEFEIPRL